MLQTCPGRVAAGASAATKARWVDSTGTAARWPFHMSFRTIAETGGSQLSRWADEMSLFPLRFCFQRVTSPAGRGRALRPGRGFPREEDVPRKPGRRSQSHLRPQLTTATSPASGRGDDAVTTRLSASTIISLSYAIFISPPSPGPERPTSPEGEVPERREQAVSGSYHRAPQTAPVSDNSGGTCETVI